MPAHVLANAKAYAALIGSVATGLLAVFTADTTVGKVLTVVVIVATAVGTWAVPNTSAKREVRAQIVIDGKQIQQAVARLRRQQGGA